MKPAFLEPRTAAALDTYVVDCVWSPDGAAVAVAGGEGAVLVVQDVRQRPLVRRLGTHGMGTLAVAWRPDGSLLASSGQDGALALWDATSLTERSRLRPGPAWTDHLAWSPNGAWLAAASGKSLGLWNAAGERVHELTSHESVITAIAWDRAGRDLAAATNGAMWVHRVEAQGWSSRVYRCPAACLTAAVSPNSKVLAAGTQDGSVHFWYLATGRDSRMSGYGSKVQLTSWSANSRYLATAAGSGVVIWDFGGKGPEGSRPIELAGHTERIDCLTFHPTGPWLASGGRDWRLSLWVPGRAAQPMDAHLADAEVSVLKWSPDGRMLAVGGAAGQLAFYELVTK
jgi:WD40 repeat protein